MIDQSVFEQRMSEVSRRETLGQIFTSSLVADFMVSRLKLPKEAKILDPCFGKGAFLFSLLSHGYSDVTGYEIDEDMFEHVSSLTDRVKLEHTDFLRKSQHNQFSGIVMNPPYIRHERIDNLSVFGIRKASLQAKTQYALLPKTANMYMYFIVHALSLLKPLGEMVVILPGSWQDAQIGRGFRNALSKECCIVEEFRVFGDVFESRALVEVIILRVIKGATGCPRTRQTLKVFGGEIEVVESKELDCDFDFPCRFSEIATVRRGLTTGCNEFYINPRSSLDISEYLHPIVSSPKSIVGYSTEGAVTDKLLMPDSKAEVSVALATYLAEWKRKVLASGSPKGLYEKIMQGSKWYSLGSFDSKGILFSYFVRNNMKFVMHESKALVRDNFFIISPSVDKYLMFALLNNFYTYCQLESAGKLYGAGLLKIQKYDIENLRFPDLTLMSSADFESLTNLAKSMIYYNNHDNTWKISSVLSRYASESVETAEDAFLRQRHRRLEQF